MTSDTTLQQTLPKNTTEQASSIHTDRHLSPAERAKDVLAHLDHHVRPQDDFFRFVNGQWLRDTQIPADETSAGTFIDLRNAAEEQVRTIIEEADAGTNIGSLFASFMDEARATALARKEHARKNRNSYSQ